LFVLQMSKFLVKFSCLTKGDLVAASLIHTTQAQPSSKAIDDVMASPAKPQPRAADADDSKSSKGKGKKGKQQAAEEEEAEQLQHEQEMDGDLGTGLGAYEAAYGEKGTAKVQQMPKTLHIQDALRTLVKEFFARIPSGKCQNCGCLNPSIKKQGSSKLFKQYSRRALLQNFARGIDVAAAVAGGAAAAAAAMQRLQEPEGMDDQAGEAAEGGKKRKRAAGSDGEQAQKKVGLTGDVFEDKSPVPSVIKKQLEEQEDWVSVMLSCHPVVLMCWFCGPVAHAVSVQVVRLQYCMCVCCLLMKPAVCCIQVAVCSICLAE
jgi:hypothetical protein